MKKSYLLPIICCTIFSIICATTPLFAPLVSQLEKSTEDFLILCGWITSPTFALLAVIFLIIGFYKSKTQKRKTKEEEMWEVKLTTRSRV